MVCSGILGCQPSELHFCWFLFVFVIVSCNWLVVVYCPFVERVITALALLSDFRKMKIKRGRASKKCRKKAGRSSTFDSEVWRPRIEDHTISLVNYFDSVAIQNIWSRVCFNQRINTMNKGRVTFKYRAVVLDVLQ